MWIKERPMLLLSLDSKIGHTHACDYLKKKKRRKKERKKEEKAREYSRG